MARSFPGSGTLNGPLQSVGTIRATISSIDQSLPPCGHVAASASLSRSRGSAAPTSRGSGKGLSAMPLDLTAAERRALKTECDDHGSARSGSDHCCEHCRRAGSSARRPYPRPDKGQRVGRMLRMVAASSNPARALPSSAALAGSGMAAPAAPTISVKFRNDPPPPHVHT
jgi:hypothetical protein